MDDVHSFRLHDRGLQRVLGSLEAHVMEIAWAAGGPVTIREVTDRLQASQPVAFTTVMTVMNRLVRKGLLRRSGARGSYTYAPAVGREAFLRRVSRRVVTGLIEDFGPMAIAQFVEALAEADPDALARLEDALRSRKASHGRA